MRVEEYKQTAHIRNEWKNLEMELLYQVFCFVYMQNLCHDNIDQVGQLKKRIILLMDCIQCCWLLGFDKILWKTIFVVNFNSFLYFELDEV